MPFDEEVESSYELSSGGLVEEFTGEVVAAAFGFDASYNEDTCILELLVRPSEEDAEEFTEAMLDEDGNYRMIFPVGDKWEDTDRGAGVQHESGKTRKFGKGSGIGLLLEHALELDGVGDVLKGRGPATQADIWVGLTFRWEDKEFTWTDRDGDDHTYTRMLPVEFIDGGEAKKPAKKAPAKKAPAKKAPAKRGAAKKAADDEPADDAADEATDAETFDIPAKLRGQLKKLAVAADDHDDFMEQAFATLDLDGDAETAVGEESFYESLID